MRRFLRRNRPVVGGTEILSGRVAREVARSLTPSEDVQFCLRGDLNHSLVLLDDRLLIVKPGFHAGSTFGALTTSIRYADITGLQVHSFLFSAWIEISTPSFQGRERKRNRHPRSSDRDVYKLPNCVPVKKRRLDECQPALRKIHERIGAAHESRDPAVPRPRPSARVVNELTRLADLHERSAIDDAEYEVAKRSLIASVSEDVTVSARIVGELTRLSELRESGAITDGEYQLAKAALLATVGEGYPARVAGRPAA